MLNRAKFLGLSLVRILLNIGLTGFACSLISLGLRIFMVVNATSWVRVACLVMVMPVAAVMYCCWSSKMRECNRYWARITDSVQTYAHAEGAQFLLPKQFCSPQLCVLAHVAWLCLDYLLYAYSFSYVSAHTGPCISYLIAAIVVCLAIFRLVVGLGAPMALRYIWRITFPAVFAIAKDDQNP